MIVFPASAREFPHRCVPEEDGGVNGVVTIAGHGADLLTDEVLGGDLLGENERAVELNRKRKK